MKNQTLKNLEALERDLSRLQSRREELAAERERADAAAKDAQDSFVAGKLKPDALVTASARSFSLANALDALDKIIQEKSSEVDAAREETRIQGAKARLIELAQAGTAARAEYEKKFRELDALLQQHAPGVLESLNSWGQIQRDFAALARQLAPAISGNAGSLGAAEIKGRQQQAESLLSEIGASADTADVRADIGYARHDYVVNYNFPDTEFASAINAATQAVGNRREDATVALLKAA